MNHRLILDDVAHHWNHTRDWAYLWCVFIAIGGSERYEMATGASHDCESSACSSLRGTECVPESPYLMYPSVGTGVPLNLNSLGFADF